MIPTNARLNLPLSSNRKRHSTLWGWAVLLGSLVTFWTVFILFVRQSFGV